jgi:hypothetical protein
MQKTIKPTARTRQSALEAAFARLDNLESGSQSLHYNVARECSVLLKDSEYLSKPQVHGRRLDGRLANILPGMTKTTLAKMFDTCPKLETWKKIGFEKVRDRAFKSLDKPLPKNHPAKKRNIDVTGKLNHGGGAGKMKMAQIETLESERTQFQSETEKLRVRVMELSSKLDQANAKLVEVMLERDELRKEVARLQKK